MQAPAEKQNTAQKWMPVMYADIYGILRDVAREHGYALAVHGSLTRDLDLLAVPWVEEASQPLVLLEALFTAIGWSGSDPAKPYHGEVEYKPHGRTAYVIHTGGGGYVDISIMPLVPSEFFEWDGAELGPEDAYVPRPEDDYDPIREHGTHG